jgi:hypothetical protein
MVVKNNGGKLTLPAFVKWALIALVLYSIYRCIKMDSENFRSGRPALDDDDREESFVGGGSSVPVPTASGTVQGTCGGGEGSGKGGGSCISVTGGKLLPVLDPCFNMREVCKQCILLEDHLFQNEKRCEDCIRKHFLTLEGLCEEAITLDKSNQYKLSQYKLPEKLRALQKEFRDNRTDATCESIAQRLRQIRKPLMAKFADKTL